MKPICFRAIRQQLLYNAHHSILQTHFLPVSRTLADHLLLPGWVCGGGGCLLLSSRRFPFSPPHRRCPPFPHSPCLVHLLIDSLEGKWMKCTRCGATSGFSSHDECCARPRSAPFLTIFLSKQLPTLSLSLSPQEFNYSHGNQPGWRGESWLATAWWIVRQSAFTLHSLAHTQGQ